MPETLRERRYRFGAFEADAATGELRRKGLRMKLNGQPFQVLLMLLDRPGELLTREEISNKLWPEGTFVDFEHGVNAAINRIREALGDTAGNPRFVETLARRGYRFIAPVEQIGGVAVPAAPAEIAAPFTAPNRVLADQVDVEPKTLRRGRILATTSDLPETAHLVVQTLFLLLQGMYLSFYGSALGNLSEIGELLAPLRHGTLVSNVLIISAAVLIPMRAFLLCAALFHAPQVREKMLRLWPLVLVFDELWSLSPFLLLHHINFGMAVACTALLVYSPFAQRSLILMGAGQRGGRGSRTDSP